ncbi:MAG: hypothetical protein ABI467_28860 [Kofleriaceae bacterium]
MTIDPRFTRIRAELATDDERAFFDQALAKYHGQEDVLERIAALGVDGAVRALRTEMPRALTTRGARFDEAHYDTAGHQYGE